MKGLLNLFEFEKRQANDRTGSVVGICFRHPEGLLDDIGMWVMEIGEQDTSWRLGRNDFRLV
jgi:hypothetical protein